jgi:hypothetical protein
MCLLLNNIYFFNFTYPLKCFRVPPGVPVPQVEYHCSKAFGSRPCVTFHNVKGFIFNGESLLASPVVQVGGIPVFGCPQQQIHYTR